MPIHLILQNWLEQRRAGLFHRQLMLISGTQQWAMAQAELIRQQFASNCLWIGEQPGKSGTDCSQYRQYLGREYDVLVYNGFSGCRANALMALSGTVRANGLMLLLCPDIEQWPEYPDPQWQKRFSYGFDTSRAHSLFITWLIEHAGADKQVLHLSEKGFCGDPAPIELSPGQIRDAAHNQDQQQAVKAILNVASGHRNRPLVLTADRGRGKSSALGMAAGELMMTHQKHILLTAPNAAQVEQVFAHAAKRTAANLQGAHHLQVGAGSLRFQPVDQILREHSPADMLMVDEAAAIPAPLLKSLVERYSRIVFSTTVQGYEGCGRGFELRFKPVLQQLRPHSRYLHLQQPIRWYEGDTLERFWTNVMLMDGPALPAPPVDINREKLQFSHLNAHQLTAQPELLHALFQLLVNAHYQTSPDDLVRLLDAPQSRIFILRADQRLVAAVLADEEGGQRMQPVSESVAAGSRRVQGHLLAQNLAAYLNTSALTHRAYLRIVRIAVAPAYWRQGLGSLCLNKLTDYAKAKHYDFIGSAFGATTDLTRFWQHNGFIPARLGLKKDMTSGEHSLIVLKALTAEGEQAQQAVRYQFQREFLALLPGPFNDLEADLVRLIIQGFAVIARLSAEDNDSLSRFCAGNGGPESAFVALQQRCLWLCQQSGALDITALIRYTLQYQSKQQICDAMQLNGRKALTQLLRKQVDDGGENNR